MSNSAVGFVLNVALILILLLRFIFVWILVFKIFFGDSELFHQSLALLFLLFNRILKLHGFISQLPYLQFYSMLLGLYVWKLLLLRLLDLKLIKSVTSCILAIYDYCRLASDDISSSSSLYKVELRISYCVNTDLSLWMELRRWVGRWRLK